MRVDHCKTCRHCMWMVGIGQGVRCKHPQNCIPGQRRQPIIADIKDCKLKEERAP
jgi:hypothetical protein